jgi:hypothetical protein
MCFFVVGVALPVLVSRCVEYNPATRVRVYGAVHLLLFVSPVFGVCACRAVVLPR